MGLFDSSRRSSVRENSDIYRDKADRLVRDVDQSMKADRYAEAEQRARQLVELQARVVGESHPEYAAGLQLLAETLIAQDELSDAEALLLRVLTIRRKMLGQEHPDYAATLELMGQLMLRWEDHAGAEPLLRQALQIRKTACGENHPDYAMTLGTLAGLLGKFGEPDAAEPFLREAVSVRRRVFGESNPETADSLVYLAEFLKFRNSLAEAEPLYVEAIEILRQAYGETHPDYVSTLSSLADLHQARGRFEKAESLWRLLIEMRRQGLGENHVECANLLTNLAAVTLRRGDLGEAANLYRRALDIRKDVLGQRHPEYATSLVNLASVLHRIGDLAGAEPLLRQALAIRKDVLGNNHPEYASSLTTLANVLRSRGDLGWAQILVKEATEIRRAFHGENHPEHAQCLALHAEILAQQGQSAKAEQKFREALSTHRLTFNDTHAAAPTNLSNLAFVARKLDHFDIAEQLLREALAIRVRLIGEAHPDYATNLGNLAWMLEQKDQHGEAEAMLERALEIRSGALGASHPDTIQYRERLSQFRKRSTNSKPATQPGTLAAELTPKPVHKSVAPPSLLIPEMPRKPAPSDRSDSEYHDDVLAQLGSDEEDDDSLLFLDPKDPASEPSEELDDEDQPLSDEARLELESIGHQRLERLVEAVKEAADFEETAIVDSPVSAQAEPWSAAPLMIGPKSEIPEETARAMLWSIPSKEPTPSGWSGDPSEPEIETEALLDPVPSTHALARSFQIGENLMVSESTPISDHEPESDDFRSSISLDADRLEPIPSSESTSVDDPVPVPEIPPLDFRHAPEPVASLLGARHAVEVSPGRSLTMSQTSSNLSQELSAISDRFSDLGERLLTASRQLHSPGLPPDEDLMAQLGTCRKGFFQLRGDACELAASLHLSHPGAEALLSLQDVTSLLDQLAEAEIHQSHSEGVRKRALWTLDRVLSLSHSGSPDFAPLRECQAKATELQQTINLGHWKSLPAETESLAEGEHAFAHLLSLIEDRDELGDDLWASLHESVGTVFGKPLAAAAARSKLVIPHDHGSNGDFSKAHASMGFAETGAAH